MAYATRAGLGWSNRVFVGVDIQGAPWWLAVVNAAIVVGNAVYHIRAVGGQVAQRRGILTLQCLGYNGIQSEKEGSRA